MDNKAADEWQTVRRKQNKQKPPAQKRSEDTFQDPPGKRGLCPTRNKEERGQTGRNIEPSSSSSHSQSNYQQQRIYNIRSPREDIVKGVNRSRKSSVVKWMAKTPTAMQITSVPETQVQETQKLINVSVNYFGIKDLRLPINIYHYEVKIARKGKSKSKNVVDTPKLPQTISKVVIQKIIEDIYKQYSERRSDNNIAVISDLSNNLYSTKDLEDPELGLKLFHQITTTDDQSGAIEIFQVEISKTGLHIDTEILTKYALEHNGSWRGLDIPTKIKTQTEQIYNALIKSIPNCTYVPVGRSGLIWWPQRPQDDGQYIGDGVTAWGGAYANFTIGWSFTMNMDLTYATFHKSGFVLDVIEKMISWKRSNPNDEWNGDHYGKKISWINSVIKNCKVIYKVMDPLKTGDQVPKEITGRIHSISNKSAQKYVFVNNVTNKWTSVYQYFKDTYGETVLKYPNGPCLLLNGGKAAVPAELCRFLKGQPYDKKLKDHQTTSLMKLARKEPKELKNAIEVTFKEKMIPSECKELKEFGVNFNTGLLTAKVRVLQPPDILYGEGLGPSEKGHFAKVTPELGEWDIWTQDKGFKFLEVKSIPKFGFLVIDNQSKNFQSAIRRFIQALVTWSSKRGMKLDFSTEQTPIETISLKYGKENTTSNVNSLSQRMEIFKNEKGCKLVFVTLPSRSPETYGMVKRAAEIKVGVLTQCIVWENIEGRADEVLQNLVGKLNCKLGGTNHYATSNNTATANIFKEPILILGADVTHPPPNVSAKGRFSFAAVTGSYYNNVMPYAMSIKAQEKPKKDAAEIIKNLDTIVAEIITTYSTKTEGCMPKRIMMFRDGVGEGQFKEVIENELEAIRKACRTFKDVNGNIYKPPITFITVQKRNKTRFFRHDDEDKNIITNAPAGTLVDAVIVHQKDTDYYLLSHRGLLGTSCPTRYRVLHDDSKLSVETLKELTYHLCYMYQRCNKSVRMPAPTYYAHYAATRAKMFAEGLSEQNLTSLAVVNESLKRDKDFIETYPMHYI